MAMHVETPAVRPRTSTSSSPRWTGWLSAPATSASPVVLASQANATTASPLTATVSHVAASAVSQDRGAGSYPAERIAAATSSRGGSCAPATSAVPRRAETSTDSTPGIRSSARPTLRSHASHVIPLHRGRATLFLAGTGPGAHGAPPAGRVHDVRGIIGPPGDVLEAGHHPGSGVEALGEWTIQAPGLSVTRSTLERPSRGPAVCLAGSGSPGGGRAGRCGGGRGTGGASSAGRRSAGARPAPGGWSTVRCRRRSAR